MKYALVSEYFYPRSKGGTEKYVYELAKKLIAENNEVEIITIGPENSNYYFENLKVYTLKDGIHNEKAIISNRKPSHNLSDFKNLLIEKRYDIVHFHTLTPAINTYHIESSKSIVSQVYFTAHVPATTCIHGDLMLYGKQACDGEIRTDRCTSCYLSKRGIPRPLAPVIGKACTSFNFPATIANAVSIKRMEVGTINRYCNKIFVFTEWQNRIFLMNGFDAEKLVKIQQMEVVSPVDIKIKNPVSEDTIIKIGFVGRICFEKGLHVLVDSFIEANSPNSELHIAAIVADKSDPYYLNIYKKSKTRENIFWNYNLDSASVGFFYKSLTFLCIPSIGYETGPYVLYEAFNYNLPVIANNMGDMKIWKDKKFPITVYENQHDLTRILKTINQK